MKKNVVIYHAHCADGVAAAWAAWLLLREDAEYIPGYYGMETPDVEGKTVFLVDFSFKRHQLQEMAKKAKAIVVLDHHASAIQDLQGIDLFRDNVNIAHCTTEKSGCQIAWDYFHSGARPPLLDIVADRDLWKFENPNTRSIMAYVMSYELDIDTFEKLSDDFETYGEATFTMYGNSILKQQSKHLKSLMKNVTYIHFDDFATMPTINANGMFASELGSMVAKEFDVALIYYIDEKNFCVSMRSSKNGPDVSKICNKYGGGGHKNAAGFKIPIDSSMGFKFFNSLRLASMDVK